MEQATITASRRLDTLADDVAALFEQRVKLPLAKARDFGARRTARNRAADAAGWFRPVHCKSIGAQETRALLTAREQGAA
jgi:hypothetical protein